MILHTRLSAFFCAVFNESKVRIIVRGERRDEAYTCMHYNLFLHSPFNVIQVVRSLLVSLAHHEAYHAMFNQFVRHNPLILEEKEYGFLKHCMGLLDYRNKLHWIRRKLNILT